MAGTLNWKARRNRRGPKTVSWEAFGAPDSTTTHDFTVLLIYEPTRPKNYTKRAKILCTYCITHLINVIRILSCRNPHC